MSVKREDEIDLGGSGSGLFSNFSLALEYAASNEFGIKIMTVEKALNIPYKYLSPEKLRDCVARHLESNIKRYVPEYDGIYIAYDHQVKRKPQEFNLLRTRQIPPFMAQRQLILEVCVDVAVFCAEIGQNLKATVTETSRITKGASAQNHHHLHKFLLSCKIANTFHIVVKSREKFVPGDEISVVVTKKGKSESSGEACLYGTELSTNQAETRLKKSDAEAFSQVTSESDSNSNDSGLSKGARSKQPSKKRAVVNTDLNETLVFDSDTGESLSRTKSKRARKEKKESSVSS